MAEFPKLGRQTFLGSMAGAAVGRFRRKYPEAASKPERLSREEAIEFYPRPRDVAAKA